MKVFVDTAGWAALYNRRDHHHNAALHVWTELKQNRQQIFTSNYVIAETITLIRIRAHYEASVQFGNAVFTSLIIRNIRATENHEKRAWTIYRKYADQSFSFIDCISFAIMEETGIHHALTSDRHFSIVGFERLLQ